MDGPLLNLLLCIVGPFSTVTLSYCLAITNKVEVLDSGNKNCLGIALSQPGVYQQVSGATINTLLSGGAGLTSKRTTPLKKHLFHQPWRCESDKRWQCPQDSDTSESLTHALGTGALDRG